MPRISVVNSLIEGQIDESDAFSYLAISVIARFLNQFTLVTIILQQSQCPTHLRKLAQAMLDRIKQRIKQI